MTCVSHSLNPGAKSGRNRPVDEPGNERFTLRGPAFALKVAAGNFACGVSLLLIIHGEREEVLGGVGLAFTDNGCKHPSLPILREHCGVGLPRYAPCLQLESAATPFDFFTINLEHLYYSNSFSRRPVPRLVFCVHCLRARHAYSAEFPRAPSEENRAFAALHWKAWMASGPASALCRRPCRAGAARGTSAAHRAPSRRT